MSSMSYISVIERYHEYQSAVQEMMASILSGIINDEIFFQKPEQCKTMELLHSRYPFVELLYVLDCNGAQISDNICVKSSDIKAYNGKGIDRSRRSYFVLAKHAEDVVVSEPYLSSVTSSLCLTAAVRRILPDGTEAYLMIDIDLAGTIEFLMGDSRRRKFQPFFKTLYSLIALVLFIVVGLLLYSSFREIFLLLSGNADPDNHLKPFGVIVFVTLALAIFDLGKTILEEEVLMHKDIFRHSSTRRTITRFMAAILIAVSIESLLLMFKAALGDSEKIIYAAWLMMCSVGLLIGLGAYVYLGAKAEVNLLKIRNEFNGTRR